MGEFYRKIPGIEAAAAGALGNELTFGFPAVLDVVVLCTANEVAILGLELFEVRQEGYITKNYSLYDLEENLRHGPSTKEGWAVYVNKNNTRADEFVRQYPAQERQVYILTASSWEEFCDLKQPSPRSPR